MPQCQYLVSLLRFEGYGSLAATRNQVTSKVPTCHRSYRMPEPFPSAGLFCLIQRRIVATFVVRHLFVND